MKKNPQKTHTHAKDHGHLHQNPTTTVTKIRQNTHRIRITTQPHLVHPLPKNLNDLKEEGGKNTLMKAALYIFTQVITGWSQIKSGLMTNCETLNGTLQ